MKPRLASSDLDTDGPPPARVRERGPRRRPTRTYHHLIRHPTNPDPTAWALGIVYCASGSDAAKLLGLPPSRRPTITYDDLDESQARTTPGEPWWRDHAGPLNRNPGHRTEVRTYHRLQIPTT